MKGSEGRSAFGAGSAIRRPAGETKDEGSDERKCEEKVNHSLPPPPLAPPSLAETGTVEASVEDEEGADRDSKEEGVKAGTMNEEEEEMDANEEEAEVKELEWKLQEQQEQRRMKVVKVMKMLELGLMDEMAGRAGREVRAEMEDVMVSDPKQRRQQHCTWDKEGAEQARRAKRMWSKRRKQWQIKQKPKKEMMMRSTV